MGKKICRKCGETKDLSEFKHVPQAFGESHFCIPCARTQKKETKREVDRRWKKNNRDKVKAQRKKYRNANRARANETSRKSIRDLTDGYVRALIHQNSGLPTHVIPDELVGLKRAQMKLWRAIRKKEEEWYGNK